MDGGNECDSNDNSKENENTEVEAVKAVEKNDNYNNEDAAENAAEDENDRNANINYGNSCTGKEVRGRK